MLAITSIITNLDIYLCLLPLLIMDFLHPALNLLYKPRKIN